jgi:hypothetical protein
MTFVLASHARSPYISTLRLQLFVYLSNLRLPLVLRIAVLRRSGGAILSSFGRIFGHDVFEVTPQRFHRCKFVADGYDFFERAIELVDILED